MIKFKFLLVCGLFLFNFACQSEKSTTPATSIPEKATASSDSKPSVTEPSRREMLGLVDNALGNYLQGCGCYYWKPGVKNASPFAKDKSNLQAQYLFMHDMGLPGRSWIMLNGQLTNLYFGEKSTFKDEKGVPHMIDTFYNGDTEVKLDAVKSSDAEDIIHYQGRITVKTLEGSEVLAFEGECGCE